MSALHRVLFGLLTAVPLVQAQSPVPDWFDPADSTLQNAANAEDNNVSAGDATRGLISAGTDPAHTVQAVIDAYGKCDAVYQSVEAASLAAPGRAGDLVQAAAIGSKCPCTGENLW